MEEDSLVVLGLWEQMESGDPELINDAAIKLNDFFKAPESVMIILNIAQNHSDIKIKRNSVVNVYRLLQRHHDKLSSDAFMTISQQLMDLLNNKLDINSKIIICDALIMYNQEKIISFDDLFSASTQMLQDESQSLAPVGLYLISHLIAKDHLPSFSIELIQFLITTSLQFLQEPGNLDASSFDLFRISYGFLDALLDIMDLNEDILTSFQPVAEYLQKTYQMLYSPDGIGAKNDTKQEVCIKVCKYFDLMSSLAAAEPSYFEELFAPIIPEINSNLINKEIDIDIRRYSLILLRAISECLPYLIEDTFTYIKNTALLAIELFEFYEDLMMIFEPSEIYKNICENFVELEESEILEKFIPNIQELNSMDNVGAFVAIFMIFDSIQKYCLESIIEQFDSFLPLFEKGISSGNPYALEIISTIITSLCQSDNSIACTMLSSFEQSLLPHANYDFVIKALKDIYDFSGNEPTDPNSSFNCLIEQITGSQDKYHVELAVECIGYLVLNVQSVLTDYFTQIHPILVQLLETNDTGCSGPALFCISVFANKSANLIKSDIPQIVGVIVNGIPERDMKFDQYAATLVTNFVDIYPISFTEFCPQILTSLISIITDKDFYSEAKNKYVGEEFNEQGDLEDNDQDVQEKQKVLHYYSAMRDDVFAAIAAIFGTYPSELADQSDSIADVIKSSCYGNTFGEEEDREEMLINLSGFYKSLTEVIPGFIKIGKDPSELITLFFESREKMHYYDIDITDAVSFWDSLKVIVSKCGAPFITKYGEQILQIIAETYEKKSMWKIYSQKPKKFILRKEFIVPITTLISRFFHDFGGDGWLSDESSTPHQFVEKAVELMQKIMQSTKSAVAQASSAIAYIIVSCGNDEQFNSLTESILNNVYPELIKSMIGDIREAAFDTISTLLYTQNKVALSMLGDQNCIQNILESTQDVIENDKNYQQSLVTSAAILWCGIVMAFDVEISQEALENVLKFLPPPPFSSMLEFVAQFAAYAYEKWPQVFDLQSLMLVGISVFATSDNYIRNVKVEHMKMLAEVLKNTPQENIEEEVNSDENNMMTIQNHIEQVLALG